MKISSQLYILFMCSFYFLTAAQGPLLQHNEKHHLKDFTAFSKHVANQTNPEYFSQHDHDTWTYFLNKAHPSVFKINEYFDKAAKEFGVPAPLLKAIGSVESNWTQIGPSIDRGWGIMHLVQNEMINTLSEAALVSGLSEDSIKEDPETNIRAAAALLADYAGSDIVGDTDISKWFEASQKFSGLSLEELRYSQARTYFEKIKSGYNSKTIWGENIVLSSFPKLKVPHVNIKNTKKSASADYPPAISDITTCNFGTGRNHVIDTWVNHWIGVGTYAGAISWFHTCRPAAPSSAHFVIRSSDGEITQVVRVANTAYHAGATGQPYNNSRSIGVEHEATATNPSLWNSIPMLDASTEMACYFSDLYNIPTTRSLPGIREHSDMPGTSTDCAGSIPWTSWMNKFTTCINGGTFPELDCSQAVLISCGITYSGDSSTDPSNVETYGCNNWTESGPERVHKVVSPGHGTLTATISNFTGDLDVYILGSCDPNDCLSTVNSTQATFTNAVAGQVYYIIVDADDGSGSSYDLLVNCPTGGNGTGLDCTNPIALQCGVTYSGPTSTVNSNVSSYACNNWTETGPERVHVITPSANGTLTASLSNYTGDLDVYILHSCDPNDCVGFVNSDSAILSDAIAGQTYYIVVDADDGSGSSYDLIVDCPSVGLVCHNAIPVYCGVTHTGPASNNPSNVDTYGCNNWTETGPERVHSFVPAQNGTITASLSNYTGDLDVYILNSCDPNNCVGTVNSDSAMLTNAIAGQTYYIVVDADDGSGSGYDLIVDCPSVGLICNDAIPIYCGSTYNGIPSNNPSYVDTYGCNNWTETGPERVHSVVPSQNGTITASLSNYTGDLDVYILNSCDPDDCVGIVNSDSAQLTNAIAGQTYYIVVDADDGSGSGYDLIVDCEMINPLCANAIQINCNQTFIALPSNAPSAVDTYGCNNWTETGPERVHSIIASGNGKLLASISNYTGDLDVYILGSCDPNDCIGTVTSENAIYNNAIAGKEYYIVVDSDDGSGSAYELYVECQSSGNLPTDNCNTIMHVTGHYEYDKTFQAEQLLSVDAEFSGNANMMMRGGTSVELMGGFEIQSGTEVIVKIDDCTSN